LNSDISSLIRIEVTTARESYPIYIGRQLQRAIADEIDSLKAQGSRLAIVTDTAVRQAIPQYFSGPFEGIPAIEVPSGETSKSLSEFGRVLDFFARNGLDRGGVAIAFGGGVVGDLTGFAAASWLRGIRFIQVPTTLLSMVDSSVGGKTGINIDSGKNLVGAFHQPISVYEDLDLLASLPRREFMAGMAEVIKYGMLGDPELFDMLETDPLLDSRDERLAGVVKRNCQAKADVVNADEKEQAGSGGRALLNLGHTFGHAVENVAGYGDYLHGEAISVGFVAAAILSQRLGYIDAAQVERIISVLRTHGLPIELKTSLENEDLMSAVRKDKKVRAGMLRFVVLRRIGEAITEDGIDPELVKSVWREIGATN
jgi:3-dehydroquinate synthase